MEISKMITVSTAHVSTETAELLENGKLNIVVFDKGDYGWFIYLSNEDDYYYNIPTELNNLMKFAKDLGCEWLCLDCDGEVLEYFEVFNW